jgi:hypothetical protein
MYSFITGLPMEWLSSQPEEADRLRRALLDRKLRLFAVAVARGMDICGQELNALVEDWADGGAPVNWRRQLAPWSHCDPDVNSAAESVCDASWATVFCTSFTQEAKAGLLRDVFGNPFRRPRAVYNPAHQYPGIACRPDEYVVLHAWFTPDVVSVARAAYEARDPVTGHIDSTRLAILADALEEEGCASEELLRHLRGHDRCYCRGGRAGPAHGNEELCGGSGWAKATGPHVRGCWALDLVLGKE